MLTIALRRTRSPRRTRGFTLIELMVALVLSLIIAGAVLALVLAIIRSNRLTLQSTRLNQELRATLSVVAADLRRARGVDDPLSSALLVGGNPFGPMSTANANCVIYAYAGAVDGPWHIVRLQNGRVVLEGAGTTRPADCTAGGGVLTQLGSDQVEITELTFTPTTTASTPPLATDENVVREITVTVSGHLVDDDTNLASIPRTMSQTVYVRSLGSGI